MLPNSPLKLLGWVVCAQLAQFATNVLFDLLLGFLIVAVLSVYLFGRSAAAWVKGGRR